MAFLTAFINKRLLLLASIRYENTTTCNQHNLIGQKILLITDWSIISLPCVKLQIKQPCKSSVATLEIKRDWPMAAIFAPLHFEESMNY